MLDRVRTTARGLAEYLARLPLILRCAAVGWAGAGTLGAIFVVISVPGEYPLGDVPSATMFGVGEAFGLAGLAGGCAGLLVGVLAYLVRAAKRRLR